MQTYGQRWRRQEQAAGSGRQAGAGGQNAKFRFEGREQPRMDSTGRRQAHGREPRTAGAAGRTREQDSRQEQRAARLPSFLCTNTFVGSRLRN